MSNTYQLVLIDGSNYLFRTYHAMPKLVSCKGQPTVATTAESPRTHLQPVRPRRTLSTTYFLYR
ncbi:uncharacterized protein METZ01_LOCUS290845 [marine metagenome]|uniref:5'-3' exonuclease alpha-helical arch N-terminal domain-containing protein n=1 Tax=marine metagenome TaxID=408172 RepID=A0A382LSV7_9ZZZZ